MSIPDGLDVTRPPIPDLIGVAMYSALRDYNQSFGGKHLQFAGLPLPIMEALQGVIDRDRELAVQIVRGALHSATGTAGPSLHEAARCVMLSFHLGGRTRLTEPEAEAFMADVMREY
ncbi:hypothetical protein ABZ485_28370 [Streptomyces albogriseolus]|jgi:hypothetical protein|uniref:hypothetical protein n=1 Tax=Streptomyces albogriseolus TaxID=1887 RepID=UPI00345FFF0C